MKKILFILVLLLMITSVQARLENIYFFYGDGCPHCAAMEPFLDELLKEYPEIELHSYEVWHNPQNFKLLQDMSSACGTEVAGVPTLFIGHKTIIGYDDENHKGKEIRQAIIDHMDTDVDLMEHIGEHLDSCPYDKMDPQRDHDYKITLPFGLGEIDARNVSLPIFTIIIGLLDGFNPCAMWMLMFLLAMLVRTKSRKKMFTVAGIFIFVSGIVYYFFMAAWLNLYMIMQIGTVLRVMVGIFAMGVGLINIKEMFFFKKGPSLTIPEKFKPMILKRMRGVVKEASIPASILGVIILAFTVNSIELLCTAGFPAIYTKILTLNNLSPISYYLYLLLYIILYMIDDIIVFSIAVLTLSSKTMTQAQGKWLKFLPGMLMLVLGFLLVFFPNALMFG